MVKAQNSSPWKSPIFPYHDRAGQKEINLRIPGNTSVSEIPLTEKETYDQPPRFGG
jgi:hypothetical protein